MEKLCTVKSRFFGIPVNQDELLQEVKATSSMFQEHVKSVRWLRCNVVFLEREMFITRRTEIEKLINIRGSCSLYSC